MIRFENLPRGNSALTPYIVVKDANRMIEFYKKAFGANVQSVMNVPETDQVMHACLEIGGSQFFLNDEFPEHGAVSPVTTGSSSTTIHIQVSEGCDELYRQAVEAGAQGVMEPADMFWGDRFAMVTDPSGHKWSIGMAIANPPQMDEAELKANFADA